MVTTDNNGCACNCTSTTGIYTNTYSGTADSTYSSNCPNCVRYGMVYIAETREPEDIEFEIIGPLPIQWKIIRSIFYAMLILRHYVEAIARAPPFMIDKRSMI